MSREQAARERAQEEDAFGLPGELWLRPLPGAAEAGPYQPAAALARFQAGRPGGLPQALLYRTSDGELKPLIGPGADTRFTAYVFVANSGRSWTGASLGGSLAWYDAVDAAARASQIPQASYAKISTDSGKSVFLFVDGTAVGPESRLPANRSNLTAEELAVFAAAPLPAQSATWAAPPPSLARPRDFPSAIQEALGVPGIRRRAAAVGRRLGGGRRRLGR